MKHAALVKQSFLYATGAVAYIFLVATFMSNAQSIFGKADTPVTGVAVLLLFVFSAAVTGSLVLGKPVLMYWDGAKKEAVKMLTFNIIWLFIWLMLFFGLALLMR